LIFFIIIIISRYLFSLSSSNPSPKESSLYILMGQTVLYNPRARIQWFMHEQAIVTLCQGPWLLHLVAKSVFFYPCVLKNSFDFFLFFLALLKIISSPKYIFFILKEFYLTCYVAWAIYLIFSITCWAWEFPVMIIYFFLVYLFFVFMKMITFCCRIWLIFKCTCNMVLFFYYFKK